MVFLSMKFFSIFRLQDRKQNKKYKKGEKNDKYSTRDGSGHK